MRNLTVVADPCRLGREFTRPTVIQYASGTDAEHVRARRVGFRRPRSLGLVAVETIARLIAAP